MAKLTITMKPRVCSGERADFLKIERCRARRTAIAPTRPKIAPDAPTAGAGEHKNDSAFPLSPENAYRAKNRFFPNQDSTLGPQLYRE